MVGARVLAFEPRLAAGISRDLVAHAEDRCVAPTVRWLPTTRGEWRPAVICRDQLVILEGHGLLRTTIGNGERAVEVMGPGTMFGIGASEDPRVHAELRVLTPMTMAVLDHDFRCRAAAWPVIGRNLTDLAFERTAELTQSLALMHVSSLPARLHQLLWRIAERWGQVTPSGVRFPFVLDQGAIADLSGARRPSVNSALRNLRQVHGLLMTDDGRFVIVDPALSAGVPRIKRPTR